jgi:ABC-2 type transport system ATP-binding protein
MAEPAIHIEGLAKNYGRIRALRGIDLEVVPGEIFGFLGPNGAGKTTTIRILMDFIRPTAGRAAIAGFDCQRAVVDVHRRVAYVPLIPVSTTTRARWSSSTSWPICAAALMCLTAIS